MEPSQIITALSALAHETRLEAFRMLVQRGPEGLPAGAIAVRLGVPPSSLTFHLQQMVHAGAFTHRRLSRQILYAADYAAMNGLIAYLTENCCGGEPACVPACGQEPKVTSASTERKSA
jgi:DNA-binding transcriptional ArsR family regulator